MLKCVHVDIFLEGFSRTLKGFSRTVPNRLALVNPYCSTCLGVSWKFSEVFSRTCSKCFIAAHGSLPFEIMI